MIQRRKIRDCVLLLIGVLFLFLSVNQVQAYGEIKKPKLKIQYGFDQYIKYGRHMPLNISVSEIEEDFEGKIQVILHVVNRDSRVGNIDSLIQGITLDSENYMYEKPVTVEKGKTCDVSFAIRLMSNTSKIRVRLVNKNDEVVESQDVNVKLNTLSSELFIGILSDEESQINFYDGVSIYHHADLTTRTFPLKPAAFPEDVYGLDSLDVILVHNFSMEGLNEKQRKALKDWISQGGTLVCGASYGSEKELEKMAELFSVKGSFGTVTEIESNFLIEESGIEVPYLPPGTAEAEKTKVRSLSIENAETILESQEISLLQKVSYGEGVVGFAGFDLLDSSFLSWENYRGVLIEEMLHRLVGNSRLSKIESEAYTGVSSEYWVVYDMLNNIVTDNLPEIGNYVIVLCIYIVFAGPVLYLILKKLDKRNYMWAGVGITSLLFSVVIFFMGKDTRFTAPFMNYTNILTYHEDSVDEQVYFNIKAPFNNPYFLYVDKGYTLTPIGGGNYDFGYRTYEDVEFNLDYHNVGIRWKDKETEVEISGLPAFTSEYFVARKRTEMKTENPLKGEVEVFQEELAGTVTNLLEYDLENAAILFYNHVIPLGTLKTGETKELKDYEISDFTSMYGYQITKMLSGIEEGYHGPITDQYIRANQKSNIFNYVFSRYFESYTDRAMLIGFSSETDQVEFQLDSGYQAYGLTLVATPIEVAYEKGGYRYDPFVKEKGEAINGDFDSYSNQMYSEELIINYELGGELEDIVLFLDEEDYYDKEYLKPFKGKLFFYNQETGIYDEKDYRTGVFSKEQLESYLTEENNILVKYIQPKDDKDYIGVKLPKLSVVGRDFNAGN